MTRLDHLSTSDLRLQIRQLASQLTHRQQPLDAVQAERQALIDELQLHQLELELQNRELRKTQRELERSRDFYAELYDQAPAGYVTLDSDGVIRCLNLTAAALFGAARDVLIGRPLATFLAPGASLPLIRHIDAVLASDAPLTGELDQRASAQHPGRCLRLDSQRHADSQGNLLCWSVLTDISNERRLANDLRQHQAELQAILTAVPIGLAVFEQHIVEWASPRLASMLGVHEHDLAGHDSRRFYPSAVDWHTACTTIDEQIDQDSDCAVLETRLRTAYGRELDVLIRVTPISTAQTQRRVVAVIDLSDQKRLEQDLRLAQAHKDAFLATLAHELRNPLTPIHVATDLLHRQPDDAAVREQALGIMARQLRSLSRLIDDLTDISRISRGKLRLQKALTPLHAPLRQAVDEVMPRLTQRQQTLEVDWPAADVELLLDPTRITQVLFNLLNNASKFSPPQTVIRLQTEVTAAAVILRVADQGQGIEPTLLPHIFDFFRQGEGDTQNNNPGLGVGLALARQFTERHGGQLSAHSDGPGRGSLFTLTLPYSPQHPEQPPQDAPAPQDTAVPPPPADRAPLILVADDQPDITDSISTLLRAEGYRVASAPNGVAALHLAEILQPNAILLDIGMPEMDGLTVCQRLRAQPWAAHLPIIALSGWGQNADLARSDEAGFDTHLLKPIDARQLLQTLAESLHL